MNLGVFLRYLAENRFPYVDIAKAPDNIVQFSIPFDLIPFVSHLLFLNRHLSGTT